VPPADPTAAARAEANPPCARRCNDCCACLAPLPRGRTCRDCAHFARCDAFGFYDAPDAGHCAFVPSRWLARREPLAAAGEGAGRG